MHSSFAYTACPHCLQKLERRVYFLQVVLSNTIFNVISKGNRGSDNLYKYYSFTAILQKPNGYTTSNRLVLMAAMLHCIPRWCGQNTFSPQSPDLCAQLL